MDKEKNQLIAVGGIVFLVVILIIIIASGGGNPTPAISESLTAGKAISLYEEAVSAVEDMKNLSMTVTQTKTTTISGDAISEERKQKITYTNIGTEEMAHAEIICAMLYQLTRGATAEELKRAGMDAYYTDHTNGIWPQSAGGLPFDALTFQSKGDPITDLVEDMAADAAIA